MPSGGEVGPGERSFNLGESELTLSRQRRSVFLGAADARRSPARTRSRSRRRSSARSRCRRASPLRAAASSPGFGYLNEVPRARLGLRRPAARLPGILRRPVCAGRRAGQVARADRPVPRARRRNRQRRRVSGHAARPQRPERRDAVRARRRRRRRRRRAGAPALSWLDLRAEDRAYEDVDALGNAVDERVHRRLAHLGRGRDAQVDAGRRSAAPQLKLQGEYMQPHGERRAGVRHRRAPR